MNITPIVVTDRKANEHFDMMKARHDEIVQGIQVQKQNVDMYNQQKEMENKENMIQQAQMQKDQMESNAKMRELDIKQQALSI